MNFDDKKDLFRVGIPDSSKRRIILEHFDLKSRQCHYDYVAIKNSVGEDFLEFTSEIQLASQHLYFDYLTEFGKKELEFMLMYFNAKMGV
jgi:hypothetical protein